VDGYRSIDALAHELELEAEILRVLSHMAPVAASDFLLRIALKVRRCAVGRARPRLEPDEVRGLDVAMDDAPPDDRPPFEIPADLTEEERGLLAPPSGRSNGAPNKRQTMQNIIRVRGPHRREDLYLVMARLYGMTFQRAKVLCAPLIGDMLGKKLVEGEDGLLRLPADRVPVMSRIYEMLLEASKLPEEDDDAEEQALENPAPATPPPTPQRETPKPTKASLARAERAKRTAQGLEGTDRRIRICANPACSSPDDVRLGKFQYPTGTVCARCDMPITTGILIVSRMARAAIGA
jgi:hypothetical protein